MSKLEMFVRDNFTKKISDAISKFRRNGGPLDLTNIMRLMPPGVNRPRARGTVPANREELMPETDTQSISEPPGVADLKLLPSSKPSEPLIYKVFASNYAQNMRNHHTDAYSYEESGLVLRRGQYFHFELTFDRDITSNDQMGLVFQVRGMENPQIGNGTFVLLRLSDEVKDFNDPYRWGGYISSIKEKQMTVVVKAACDCPVTEWEFSVTTRLASDIWNKDTIIHFFSFVTFLFNPWCKDDPVYHSDEAARQEYVLSRRVFHFTGEPDKKNTCEWELGQFEGFVLRGALEVLQKWVQIDPSRMGCPVQMGRSLLLAVCKNGREKGILKCQQKAAQPIYDASYLIKEGIDEGSPQPGQSFTCAAVLASLCRSLGLPCRLVSALSVACLKDNYRTSHMVFDVKGKLLWSNGKRNFHCWVDVWMRRPDISDNKKYDGWQALDVYCGGPCPVLAIKYNLSVKPYDSEEFHAMLNSDSAIWRYTIPVGKSCNLKLLWYIPSFFGSKVFTKAIGSSNIDDLTKHYKIALTPEEEAATIEYGLSPKENPYAGICFNPPLENFHFELHCPREPLFGQKVKMHLIAKNNSDKVFHIKGVLQAFSQTVDHTDQIIVHSFDFQEVLEPLETTCQWLHLEYEHYKKEVQSYRHMIMYGWLDVIEAGHTYFKMFRLQFRYPEVIMNYTRGSRGQVEVNCMVDNILPISLSQVQLMFLCTRWKKTIEHTLKDFRPNEKQEFKIIFEPGDCRVIVLTASLRAKDINRTAEHIFITDS